VLGEPEAAVQAAETCAAHGIRVGCFRPPSVPKGRACLRLTGRATVTEADFTTLREALRAVAGLYRP
ncbi:8-amino-7-oxononanoate synthase, partial [Actinomadura adrarensis]